MGKTAKTQEWQVTGGKLEIPSGWFLTGADFDCAEPFIQISEEAKPPEYERAEDRKIPVPKALAFYLSTHWCGSKDMAEKLIGDGERRVQNAIKRALGMKGV